MPSKTLGSAGAEVDSAVSARSSPREPNAAAKAVKEQGAVLFALHTNLCKHQKSVNQAFTSLGQACRALVASVVAHQSTETSPPEIAAHSATSTDTSADDRTTATSAAGSAARQFAQLLRRVEALHQFLFTNLYVHQRESALQLLVGVERFVLEAADSSDVDEASRDAAGYAELRSQIAQLRYRLSNASHALAATACDPFLHTSCSAPVAASTTIAPAPSSSSLAVTSPPRLFALSSHFLTSGEEGQRSLLVVLRAAQRRFGIHGVVLSSTGSHATPPMHEVQLARQLGCLCLVIPHQCRRTYPAPSPIPTPTDRDVLTYDRACGDHNAAARGTEEDDATGRPPSATPPPPPPHPFNSSDDEDELMSGGADARTSALEQLFLSLEAEMPGQGAELTPLWSPTAALTGNATVDRVECAEVVHRAALKRAGRQPTHRLRRPRHDSQHNPPLSSSTPATVTPASSASLDTMAEPFRRCAGSAVCPSQPGETADDAVSNGEHSSLFSPHTMESQHIGVTQYGLPPTFSGSVESAGHTTPLAVQPEVADEASAVEEAPARPPLFQISNSVRYLKPQLIEAVEQLGGVVDLSSGYSPGCRFLIVAEGITERTEKYLGACAAAAFIVPPRYVFDSQRRGYWLANRVHEYDMSPQRAMAHQPRPPPIFRNWRVVLITCRSAAARGIRAALLAGGCTQATAFVVDLTAEAPISVSARTHVYDETSAVEGVVEGVCPTSAIAATTLAAATHILVECSSVTAQGCFQLPDWVPICVRRPEYASRVFTLELLYFCLCTHPERIFNDEGLLCDEEALTPACRVEPV
ncbi:hypothetical protein ABB37_02023 [Leptomonas pyrrhocoris]|uniref:BRCT domain-containing protein n=1 Tax=Leptomonas pyrrhocoris TaxID=157538 RepID=A0A0M9G6W7_LEPPY|nr:hypothetical protein ABB37_02023 [Leptomonas pyrrhocoris]KPA83810.1 hypothetical protein ABB37_02023 [Leptomonas pyrrhocoris]|eukprot:XP_015662249.1 hypothetical protein ABB37_02023 [Leptomonas pyrrhocoris]